MTTIRARILGTIALIAMIIAGPAIYTIAKLTELRDIATELRGRHAEAFLSLGRLHAALLEFDRLQRTYLVVPDHEQYAYVDAALESARRELGRLGEAGYSDAVVRTSDGLATIQAAAITIDSLIQEEEIEAATTHFMETRPVVDEVLASLEPLAQIVDETSSSAAEEARTISKTATSVAMIALLIAILVATTLAIAATEMLVAPLNRLRGATRRVAAGELVEPTDLPYERTDEIGDLSRSFHAMTERLAELDRLKGEFISIASHELKTPINVIGGYAELLEDGIYGELTPDQKEAMRSIRAQARDLTELADHLLDLGRVEAGNFPVQLETTELRPIFAELERAFQALAIQKGIDFSIELDPHLPLEINADPLRLRREVLGNLLANAFKFTPKGGRIRLTARVDDKLEISVTDSGPGIPEELLPHIFDKFYQVRDEGRARPKVGGSGLGLAIVREVVEAHRGKIWAESTKGAGTTMTMRLPLPDRDLSTTTNTVILNG